MVTLLSLTPAGIGFGMTLRNQIRWGDAPGTFLRSHSLGHNMNLHVRFCSERWEQLARTWCHERMTSQRRCLSCESSCQTRRRHLCWRNVRYTHTSSLRKTCCAAANRWRSPLKFCKKCFNQSRKRKLKGASLTQSPGKFRQRVFVA